jgi:hypothetical protein
MFRERVKERRLVRAPALNACKGGNTWSLQFGYRGMVPRFARWL